MLAKYKILAIAIAVTVITGSVVGTCVASILPVSIDQPTSISCASDQDETLPEQENVLRARHDQPANSSMTGFSSAGSSSGGTSILISNISFDIVLSSSEKVYFQSLSGIPKPPIYELLKVPIAS